VATRRVEVGFEGGTVLRLTIEETAVDELTASLGGDGWRSFDADEGQIWISQKSLVYVRVVPGEAAGRIGFRE
jgi:hypothetical protein